MDPVSLPCSQSESQKLHHLAEGALTQLAGSFPRPLSEGLLEGGSEIKLLFNCTRNKWPCLQIWKQESWWIWDDISRWGFWLCMLLRVIWNVKVFFLKRCHSKINAKKTLWSHTNNSCIHTLKTFYKTEFFLIMETHISTSTPVVGLLLRRRHPSRHSSPGIAEG